MNNNAHSVFAGRPSAGALSMCGIIAPLLWATAVIVNGALVPGYSHSRQYISELAAQGSPTQRLMQITGFVLPGLLVTVFGASVATRTRARLVEIGAAFVTLSGLSRLAAGFLPCDVGCGSTGGSVIQHLHDAAGLTFLLMAVLAAAIWVVIDARGPNRSIWRSAFSLATVALTIGAGPLLVATGAAHAGDVGASQRVSLGALNFWLLVLALRQFRSLAGAEPPRSASLFDCSSHDGMNPGSH